MKKLFSFIAAALLCAGVQAQIVSSRSQSIIRSEAPVKQSKTQWYVRGGLNIMSASGIEESGSRVGYDLSFGFQKPMGSIGLYWGMDMGLGSRGWSCEEYGDEIKLIAHNMKYSPFNFGYQYAFTNDLKLDAHTSVFMSIDYIGSYEEKFDGHSESCSIWDLDGDYDYIPFDAGWQIGVGLWWKKLNFDLTYQRGFVNWVNGDDGESAFSNNFMIRVGYAF